MSTSKVTYIGNLRTENEHLKSGATFITDAPTDNNGKGEAFSPTDTVATGLANCMLTVMGIKARTMEVELAGSSAVVWTVRHRWPARVQDRENSIDIAQTYTAANSICKRRKARVLCSKRPICGPRTGILNSYSARQDSF